MSDETKGATETPWRRDPVALGERLQKWAQQAVGPDDRRMVAFPHFHSGPPLALMTAILVVARRLQQASGRCSVVSVGDSVVTVR